MTTLNLNVGILGHVDSGKTSISKCLSTISSTACFDKSPQSQERGITLDLGFSCFTQPIPDNISNQCTQYSSIRFTLVDCPGHSSLVRTIIGGSQIIDMMILVIDANQGVEAQTGECLVLGELTCSEKLIVTLNKIDLVSDPSKLDKLERNLKKITSQLKFKEVRIVRSSAKHGNVQEITKALIDIAFVPDRTRFDILPFIFSVDHCFTLKGKGIIMTGTVISGTAHCGNSIEIPKISNSTQYTIKSIQVFKEPVQFIHTGDRAGICINIKNQDVNFERGLISSPGEFYSTKLILAKLTAIRFYKHPLIVGKAKMHLTMGHFTSLARVLVIYECQQAEICSLDHDHLSIDEINADNDNGFVLLELDNITYMSKHVQQLIILSKLDENKHNQHERSCRFGFYGYPLMQSVPLLNVQQASQLMRVYKIKQRTGVIIRSTNDPSVYIGDEIFKQGKRNVNLFIDLKVKLSTGEDGKILSMFGNQGKVKIQLSTDPSEDLLKQVQNRSCKVPFTLVQKKYTLDKMAKPFQ
ncbi:hypothetical protein GJ496_007628 [Pomphorhynchus laevis]|nr:hypothetical protein GJ496_007628 [Pomphorhynchus laevis]